MTTFERPEQDPRIASPDQLRILMESAESLLNTGTLDCKYRLRHETSFGTLCYESTEIVDEEGEIQRVAEFHVETLGQNAEVDMDEEPAKPLGSFTFRDADDTHQNSLISDEEGRKRLELSRSICVDVLMSGEALDESESAILLFILREHAALLDDVTNGISFVVDTSWNARSPLLAMGEFTRARPDHITETLTYAKRRDDGDYIEVNHMKVMQGNGEPISVQTEIEFRDALDDMHHFITCEDERFEDAFAYAYDGEGNPVLYGDFGNKPYADKIEEILEVIHAEKGESPASQKLQKAAGEIINTVMGFGEAERHDLDELRAKTDEAWMTFALSPKGSMAETQAIIEMNKLTDEFTAAMEKAHNLKKPSFPYKFAIDETLMSEGYLENNFSRLRVTADTIHKIDASHAQEKLPPLNESAVELFYLDFEGCTMRNKYNPLELEDAGITVKGFFRITHNDYPVAFIAGYVFLKELAIFEE